MFKHQTKGVTWTEQKVGEGKEQLEDGKDGARDRI